MKSNIQSQHDMNTHFNSTNKKKTSIPLIIGLIVGIVIFIGIIVIILIFIKHHKDITEDQPEYSSKETINKSESHTKPKSAEVELEDSTDIDLDFWL